MAASPAIATMTNSMLSSGHLRPTVTAGPAATNVTPETIPSHAGPPDVFAAEWPEIDRGEHEDRAHDDHRDGHQKRHAGRKSLSSRHGRRRGRPWWAVPAVAGPAQAIAGDSDPFAVKRYFP